MFKQGFSIIEVLISIAVIAVVAVIFASALSLFKESGQLDESQSAVLSMLREARARTLASEANTNYGVHFEATKTVLFRGSSYGASDASNETYFLPSLVEVSNISLAGGGAEVVFQRLSGTTTSSGTVTLQSKSNPARTRTITIYATGNAK